MTNYYLHFVGNHLYGAKRFIAEAKRLKVQRAVPFYFLKNIEFGMPILLAEHVKEQGREYATIFGYFAVQTIVNNLPEEVRRSFHSRLNFLEVSSDHPEAETRGCGSYIIAGGITVDNSVQEIKSAIKEACEEHGVNVLATKYFLRGSFTEINPPVLLQGQKFFRGYGKVSIDGLDITEVSSEIGVIYITDYERKFYVTKKERDKLDTAVLDEFMVKA